MNALPRAQQLEATVPGELLALTRWLPWLPLPRAGGRLGKVPALPVGGRLRPVDCRGEGQPWNEALVLAREHRAGGVGVVLTAGCGLVALDLDAPLSPETRRHLAGVAGYAEHSPSGRGIHLWLKGELPRPCRKPGQEWLSQGYVTVTAAPLSGRTRRLGALDQAQAVFDAPAAREPLAPAGSVWLVDSDQTVLARLGRARNGVRALRLLAGDWAGLGYATASEGDLAAVRLLRFYTQDHEQIARLLWASGLRRDKWVRGDYLTRTIERALALGGPMWEHRKRRGAPPAVS